MLLNLAIFMWLGAVCPWSMFVHNNVISIQRLVFISILVLLLRRLPAVYAVHRFIPQIKENYQAVFTGFFGPIGGVLPCYECWVESHICSVSAVFYLYISLECLKQMKEEGHAHDSAERLAEVMTIVVWFLIISSIVSYSTSQLAGRYKC
jgi:hypothetical protein